MVKIVLNRINKYVTNLLTIFMNYGLWSLLLNNVTRIEIDNDIRYMNVNADVNITKGRSNELFYWRNG